MGYAVTRALTALGLPASTCTQTKPRRSIISIESQSSASSIYIQDKSHDLISNPKIQLLLNLLDTWIHPSAEQQT